MGLTLSTGPMYTSFICLNSCKQQGWQQARKKWTNTFGHKKKREKVKRPNRLFNGYSLVQGIFTNNFSRLS